ncbi:LOW QUALITY PROTEIN: signaling lymphocytic activation molecule [Ctenodactylus gundi]
MDPLRLLLFLSLAFELSNGADRGKVCPKFLQKLGNDVLLPLTSEWIDRGMNKSLRIVVTMGKSSDDNIKKKIVSLNLPEAASSYYLEPAYQFHPENLSLGILGSKKENEGWYTMTLEDNFSVRQFCVQLKLYEQVSTPEIQVLNKTQENENGSCSLLLACTVENGDNVTYGWSEKGGTHLLSPANSSHLLSLTVGPQHANDAYVCTASNPVSNRTRTIKPWSKCTSYSSGSQQWGLYAGLLSGGIMGIILILQVVLLLWRRRECMTIRGFLLASLRCTRKSDDVSKAKHFQSAVEEKNLTIYAQVQKTGPLQSNPDVQPAQDPCTTIYVAATEPVPESAPESNPITVYASLTLPKS